MRRRLSVGLWVLAALVPFHDAQGNAGPIDWPPDVVGEPAVDFASIVVVREQLFIDLRPAASFERRGVPIEAEYQLRNDGPEVTVPAAFASPSAGEASVTLDGVRVEARSYDPLERPAPVLPPHWGRALPEGLSPREATWFDLTVGPGEHTLTVQVIVAPGGDLHDRPGTTRVDYLLAPARDWGGFERLDVRVEMPPGHLVETTPSLTVDHDAAVGSFEGLPADLLQIHMREQVGMLPRLGLVGLVLLGLVLLGVVARWSARTIARTASAWVPVGVIATPVVAVGLALGWFALYDAVDRAVLGPHAAYGSLETLASAIIVAFVAGCLAAGVGLRGRRAGVLR